MSAASFQTSCCLGAFLLLSSAAVMPARLVAGTGWGRPPLMVVQCRGGAILVHFACLGMYAIAMPHHLHTGRPARVLAACIPCGGTGGWAGPMLIFSTIRQVTCRPLSRGTAAHASSHAGPCCRNAIVAGSPCRLSATAACASRPDLESVCRRTNSSPTFLCIEFGCPLPILHSLKHPLCASKSAGNGPQDFLWPALT